MTTYREPAAYRPLIGDGFRTELQETGRASVFLPAKSDIGYVVDAIRAAANDLGIDEVEMHTSPVNPSGPDDYVRINVTVGFAHG